MEMWSLGTKLQSVSKKQRQAPHWRAWDQHVTQRRNVPESRDVERKGFQTTQSHFQQGRSDFRRPVYLPVCYSAVTTRWWRSACPSLRPVLSEQPHWANNRRQCLSNSLKTSFASCKTQTTTREALHTHTQSHEPDNPFTGLDPWTLGSSFTCYDSIHAAEAVSPTADCSAYLLARFPRSELRPPARRTITL